MYSGTGVGSVAGRVAGVGSIGKQAGMPTVWKKALRLFHRHRPESTGRAIKATFGKYNLPEGQVAVASKGWEAYCKCGARFIIHGEKGFTNLWTELL